MALPSVFGIKGMLLSAAFGGAVMTAATMWADSQHYGIKIEKLNTKIAEKQASLATDSLKQLTDYVAGMNTAGTEYKNSQGELLKEFNKLKRAFADATRKNPLPVDCKPDPFRVQHYQRAIDAANAPAARK